MCVCDVLTRLLSRLRRRKALSLRSCEVAIPSNTPIYCKNNVLKKHLTSL